MPRAERPYSRVYWGIIDDEKFADVYSDDRALAAWLRLLIQADQAWPASAILPATLNRSGLRKLVDAQLVDVNGSRFRIRGLDAERARRARQGTVGAAARWNQPPPLTDADDPSTGERPQPQRNTNAYADRMRSYPGRNASQDETRQDENETRTSARATANGSSTREPDPVLELQALAEELTGQPYAALNPYAGLGAKAVSEQLLPHGFERTAVAWREVARRHGSTPPTIRQLVLEADDLLNPIARSSTRSAADADDADVRAGIEQRLAAARAAKGAQA